MLQIFSFDKRTMNLLNDWQLYRTREIKDVFLLYLTKNKKFFRKKFGVKIIIYNFAHYWVDSEYALSSLDGTR